MSVWMSFLKKLTVERRNAIGTDVYTCVHVCMDNFFFVLTVGERKSVIGTKLPQCHKLTAL